MPNASLLVMTSPLLLGPGPLAVAVEPVLIAQAPAPAPSIPLLDISWSIAPARLQEALPAEEGASEAENEIVVEGEYGPLTSDPVGAFNEESYRITRDLDEAFLEPVAYAYRDGLPDPLRDGLGNVVRNLSEPANFLNFLLQLKVGKAVETLGRFAINSTLGLGGLIDIAEKPGVGLPYRRNGFANTLGYYGVDSGAYLYLPITGATSVRDVIGNALDQFVLPTAFGRPFNQIEFAVPYFMISSLDARLEVDAELERIDAAIDPYSARRDTYLYRRERDIAELRGVEPPAPPAILEEVEGTGEFSEDYDPGAQDDDLEESGNGNDFRFNAPAITYGRGFAAPRNPVAITITRPVLPSTDQPGYTQPDQRQKTR